MFLSWEARVEFHKTTKPRDLCYILMFIYLLVISWKGQLLSGNRTQEKLLVKNQPQETNIEDEKGKLTHQHCAKQPGDAAGRLNVIVRSSSSHRHSSTVAWDDCGPVSPVLFWVRLVSWGPPRMLPLSTLIQAFNREIVELLNNCFGWYCVVILNLGPNFVKEFINSLLLC